MGNYYIANSGGIGDIYGHPGNLGRILYGTSVVGTQGATGAGQGGAIALANYTSVPNKSNFGAGGSGGSSRVNSSATNGGKGGDGVVWIEYFDPEI